MGKIVNEGLKVDLHIHSCYSAAKDSKRVKDGTKENLPLLIAGLNIQNVNMCAITDHDNFNYELYVELKKQEGIGSIKKVLPGIEFSVLFDNGKEEKVVHIVTIFDDIDDKKIEKLEGLIKDSKIKGWFDEKRKAYKENGYLAFLRQANISVVMIAHQKNSITSVKGSQNTSVMALGKEKFDELLFLDYFDSYEFHNKQNEFFHKKYIWENNLSEKLRFVTGSDCHEWSKYVEEGEAFNYTYIKALPTFKGLAMAMTDINRIKFENGSFFNPNAKYYDELNVEIDGENVSIPLSRGLNAIIGDNSVGKSLFLHALTGYNKTSNAKLLTGYNKYLNENSIVIETTIAEEDIYMFNTQGEIREIFDKGLSTNDFLKKFYPLDIQTERYRRSVDTELERFYRAIKEKLDFDKLEDELQSFRIPLKGFAPKSLTFSGSVVKLDVANLKKLCEKIQVLLEDIKEIAENPALEKTDVEFIRGYAEPLNILLKKYNDKLKAVEWENKRINIYNSYMNRYKSEYEKKTSEEQKIYLDFLLSKENAINEISLLLKQKIVRKAFEFNVEPVEIIPECNMVDEYAFISKIGIERVDNDYMQSLCTRVLKKKKEINTTTITENELRSIISNYPNELENVLEGLKMKVTAQVEADFKVRSAVNRADKDMFKELSTGMNSQIYFTLLSGEKRDKGVYLVDQPEDHISQKAIRETVLNQFKEMGRSRQVILVTHNPQFIVNLDVDNVIFLSKEDGKFKIQSGALEYENEEYKILKIIADNIDGGLDTIKGRLKRYGKENGDAL